jgi:hypothetical protein
VLRDETTDQFKCAYELDEAHSEKNPIAVHDPKEEEMCWIHDDLFHLGARCLESGCALFQESVWHSALHQTKGPGSFKGVWEPYGCKLPLYTDKMLGKCMGDFNLDFSGHGHKYLDGASIAEFFNVYFEQRLDQFAKNVYRKPKQLVHISTFAMVHKLWDGSEQMWLDFIDGLPDTSDGTVRIYIAGPFITSEREAHVSPGRFKRFFDIARPRLAKKGWIELDWVKLSMGQSFDSCTQYDGACVPACLLVLL